MGISSHEEHVVFAPSVNAIPPKIDYHNSILDALAARRTLLDEALLLMQTRATVLSNVAMHLVNTLRSGHKVLVVGNGGSAAEAQHFAAELVGRFKRDRAPYAVLSLTTDTAILTSVANDYGYEEIFSRQVQAFGQRGDLLLAFSTSGESPNVVQAAEMGQEHALTVIAVTADRASTLERIADLTVRVPVADTDAAQELHMMVTHILCDIVETQLSAGESEVAR